MLFYYQYILLKDLFGWFYLVFIPLTIKSSKELHSGGSWVIFEGEHTRTGGVWRAWNTPQEKGESGGSPQKIF